jgi:hypothetical protein
VSSGRSYYGKGGGYNFFAGKDAARAYITGCFETHLTHDLRGLSEEQIAVSVDLDDPVFLPANKHFVKSLSQWSDFYENNDKYFYVGQVIHKPIPEDAPIPEMCQQ